MSEQQKMSYEEVIESWVEAYKFCIRFEAAIAMGQEPEEDEMKDYLNNKAQLIVTTADIFITKCVNDKGAYDKEYVQELYEGLKTSLNEEGLKLLEFDENYIQNIIDEIDPAMIEEVIKEEQVEAETEPTEE